jgi:acetolactate synthase I/II/III large subunit
MTRMTGGEAIVGELLRHGVDTVFGLPGAQTYGLFDALHAQSDKIRVIGARHEQACAYMAMGYARATGRPGVCSVVPGPGILNASAALLTAYGVNAPVLAITGQVPRAFFGRGRGHLHEMPDQLNTMRGFTKWADRIEHPANAPRQVAEAFQQMMSGRQGPVALEGFWDMFTDKCDATLTDPLPLDPAPVVDPDLIARSVEMIVKANAPMIFVGGGAVEAAEEVLDLARRIQAPVVSLRNGRGIVSEADDFGMDLYTAHKLWPETDLMIAIGTRLEILEWRWSGSPEGLKTIRIDVDPREMRRYPCDVNVLADALEGTATLNEGVTQAGHTAQDRSESFRTAKVEARNEMVAAVQPQMSYLDVMRDVLPDDGILVDDLSQVGFTSWFGYPVYAPRTYIQSGHQGTLGSGYPTALGVKVACPDRAVLSFCGDGGFMFAVQELATAKQYNIALPVIVFNNNSFGNVRRDQTMFFDGHVIGAELENPDFVKLAESFGVKGTRVSSPEELRPELERALAAYEPCLIEVQLERGGDSNPWPFIHPKFPGTE